MRITNNVQSPLDSIDSSAKSQKMGRDDSHLNITAIRSEIDQAKYKLLKSKMDAINHVISKLESKSSENPNLNDKVNAQILSLQVNLMEFCRVLAGNN